MTTPSPTSPAGTRRPPPKSGKRPPAAGRRRARELALQGLYQWLLSGADGAEIETHVLAEQRDDQEAKADAPARAPAGDALDRLHFEALLHGCIAEAATLDAALARHVDRPTKDLSPIEHGCLLIGTYEMTHCIDIPYRVVINEAVELAKTFGGTDGHKYVNGVLDRCAADLRPVEVQARRAQPPR